jgi:uncharacterized protein YrrD
MKEGAKVIAADGEPVGKVEQILTDPQADRVTDVVVTNGLLSKERKRVPISWISQVREDEVRLAVGSHLLDKLRAYSN